MEIKNVPSQWRSKYKQASFRGAIFFVETDARQGGRRVALHQYPKRNIPYAEDMGRAANRFVVQGFLIGHWPYSKSDSTQDQSAMSYLILKDKLIDALEQDGPGTLRLPLPFQMSDIDVMVTTYSVTESRERGGVCMIEMDFVEYGSPTYRAVTSTPDQVEQSAANVEKAVTGPTTPDTENEAAAYGSIYESGGPG